MRKWNIRLKAIGITIPSLLGPLIAALPRGFIVILVSQSPRSLNRAFELWALWALKDSLALWTQGLKGLKGHYGHYEPMCLITYVSLNRASRP